ncbi:MAG TPA: YhgE/Pip domain-containing protein [Propionibacteriaceae bacterium]|nr:YhgE/Pip domain-containing protein [Propionibacteriaceae bacterium]
MNISRRLWTLLGLLLVPLVVAGGFLWATWDYDSRLERVEAAVVNLDEPVRLDGQLVPLGRQLAGGLVEGPEEENFRWTLTDNEDAADGLAAGRYAAVVTIPADFSARATSFSENDADAAERATIEVQTSEVSGIADPVVGRAVTAAATRVLNTELTEQYLNGIYLGFNQLNRQFGTLADGADKLADGAGDLSDGLSQSATGGRELADGLDQLDRGADQLATGTRDLANGAGQLSTGLGQLAGGVTGTANGADDLAAGTDQLADGADGVADGARDLSAGTRRLDRGAEQLADGADDLAGGVAALRNGTASQPGGTKAYAAGVREFAGGLDQYQDQLNAYAEQADAQLARLVPCPAELPVESCPVFYAGLRAGTTIGAQGLADQGEQPGLLSSAERLADGAAGIDAGVGRLQTGATTYARGVDTFADGVGELATGTGALARGARELAGGAGRLASGTGDLADGLDQLAAGAGRSATGARDLATGTSQLSTGVSQLAVGTGQSADGTGRLADGLTQLSTGGKGLADGTREFADGIADGRREVPTYTESERDRLSGVVSAPVAVPASDGASYSDIATTTLLVVLALWLGGLAAFVVLRPVTARVLASMKPSWRLAFEALGPAAAIGAVQAVVLSVVLQRLLDLSVGQTAALVPFAMLTAVTFAAVNQALVAAMGGLGRFLSVLAAVVVTAGALTAAAPALFAAVVPYLPLTPALQGIRALVSDGGGVGPAAGVLVGWLLLAISVSVLSVARRRMLPASIPSVSRLSGASGALAP